jgi:hypothetical protein
MHRLPMYPRSSKKKGFQAYMHQFNVAGFTFPYNDDAPAETSKCYGSGVVPGYVIVEFIQPKFRSRLRRRGTSAIGMTMPETPVDENHAPKSEKHNIWFARQPPIVKSKTKPLAVKIASNHALRSGILARHLSHQETSTAVTFFLRIAHVGHGYILANPPRARRLG